MKEITLLVFFLKLIFTDGDKVRFEE